jgi:hypothetical protein
MAWLHQLSLRNLLPACPSLVSDWHEVPIERSNFSEVDRQINLAIEKNPEADQVAVHY